MFYYQFNIGDYATHTRHLSPMEDLAYRRLLDWYYLHEKPIPLNPIQAARVINLNECLTDVEQVLNEFFNQSDEGWICKRADVEINKFHKKIHNAVEAGKASAKAKLNGRSTDVQPTNNQEPITKNQVNQKLLSLPAEKPPKADAVPYQDIINLYHQILPKCPRVMQLTGKRKGQIAARWKSGVLPDLETWEGFFKHCSESRFLMGLTDPPVGRKRFVADIEWITNETNFTKIWENKYHG